LVLAAALPTGCWAELVKEVDPAQIEAVVSEYYQAFNSYDLSRIEAVFAKEAWQEEKGELNAWVHTAESLGFKSEFVSIAAIRNNGDSVLATVEVESDLGLDKDYVRLVRELSGWKIVEVLTKKVGQVSPPEETPADSSCCPQ
jgi:hypothetical protein